MSHSKRRPKPAHTPKTPEDLLLFGEAGQVRSLFGADQAARRAFRGLPHTEELVQELRNTAVAKKNGLSSRKRHAFGVCLFDKNRELVGYTSFTIVLNAKPTAYEKKYVWTGRPPELIRGIFLHRLIVHPKSRRKGLGAKVISNILLGKNDDLRLYADVKADNTSMRSCAEKAGGSPNMFWHTPQDTLMVRYIWM